MVGSSFSISPIFVSRKAMMAEKTLNPAKMNGMMM